MTITIDGAAVQDITIDGTQVQEVTIDGSVVWTASLKLTTTATLNGETVDVTVYEDTDGDGVADNQETVTIADGTNTYELTTLDGVSGNTLWAEAAISTTSVTTSPVVHAIDPDGVDAWNTATEWDNAQSESRVVHETYTDTAASDVQLGYPSYMSNLVALYPLDEDSGSTAYEYVNALDGTLNGPTVGQAGGVLNTTRYSFDGVDDYVDLGAPAALQLKQPLTIAGWVEFNDLSSQRCITTWANASQNYYPFHLVMNTDGTIRFNQGEINPADSATSLNTGTLYFIAVTKDSNDDVRFYIDGSPDSNNPQAVGTQTNDGDTFCALGRDDNQYMDGYENYMMYFNAALSDTEIQDLYDTTSSGSLTTSKRTI